MPAVGFAVGRVASRRGAAYRLRCGKHLCQLGRREQASRLDLGGRRVGGRRLAGREQCSGEDNQVELVPAKTIVLMPMYPSRVHFLPHPCPPCGTARRRRFVGTGYRFGARDGLKGRLARSLEMMSYGRLPYCAGST